MMPRLFDQAFRLLALLSVIILALTLAGCNSSQDNATEQSSSKIEETAPTKEQPTQEKAKQPEPAVASSVDPDLVYLDVKSGRIEIKLASDLAPNHVKQIKTLVKRGFYDGIVFHRVIEGFMAQTGDPTGTGRGGSDLPDIKAEFSNEPFKRGVLGMARSSNPNSANSQFFIMFAPGDFLNGEYTVVGKVVKGMEHVDAIKKGNSAANGTVTDPDKIIKMQMAQDAN